MGEEIYLVTDKIYDVEQNNCFGNMHRFASEYCEAEGIPFKIISVEEAFAVRESIRKIIDRTLHYANPLPELHTALAGRATYLNSPELMGIFASKVKLQDLLEPLKENLIPSVVVESESDFLDHLSSNVGRTVVLKPDYGGMGDDVFFIEVKSSEHIFVKWREGSDQFFEGDPREFFDKKVKFTVYKKWLGQEFVRLSKIDSSVLDIRVVRQALKPNTKRVSDIYGRQSVGVVPITNLEKNGLVVSPESVQKFLIDRELTVDHLLGLCEDVESIVKPFGNIGEVGHDIGIDENGKLVYIEGNTMPGYRFSNWAKIIGGKEVVHFFDLPLCDQMLVKTPIDYLR